MLILANYNAKQNSAMKIDSSFFFFSDTTVIKCVHMLTSGLKNIQK